MPIIAKPYTLTIVSGCQITASSVIRAFDDIYDAVNGGIDTANILSSMTLYASRVSLGPDSRSFYSATSVSVVSKEFTWKGWNSVHVMGLGTAGFMIFPGVIEINQQLCRVNSKIHYSGALHISFASTATGRTFLLLANQAPVLTASDFSLMLYTGTGTIAYEISKNGYYHSSTKRGITTLQVYLNSSNDSATDWIMSDEFLQRPSIGHRHPLSSTQLYYALGFTNNDNFLITASIDKNRITSVVSVFDMDELRYYYEAQGTTPSATTVTTVMWHRGVDIFTVNSEFDTNSSPSAGAHHHWYVQHAKFIRPGAARMWEQGGGNPIYGTGTTVQYMKAYFNNTGNCIVSLEDATAANQEFNIVFRRRTDSMRRV